MAYGLTKSLDIEKSSTQCAYVADNTAFDFSSTFTIEAWVNAESLPSDGTNHAIVGKWQTAGDNRSYVFRLNNTGGTYTLQMVTDANGVAGGASSVSSSSLTISTATWYHVAVSVSAGTVTFYFNGVSSGGGSGLATPFNGASALTIGAERADGTDGWDGQISLVRLWKGAARSVTEIQDNACGVLGATASLSAEWLLDDAYTDNSGNGFTLTALNTPVFSTSLPSVCLSISVAPPLGSITLTGYAPTFTFVNPVTVSPPLGSITLTNYAPTLRIGIWTNQTKNASSFSNSSKSASTWTNQTKS